LAEPAVVDFYSRIEFPPEFVGLVRSMVAEVLNDADLTQRLRGRQLVKERADLEKKEANLIELAADGELSSAKVRVRIREI
jgi:site-specific DNA recombinase